MLRVHRNPIWFIRDGRMGAGVGAVGGGGGGLPVFGHTRKRDGSPPEQ